MVNVLGMAVFVWVGVWLVLRMDAHERAKWERENLAARYEIERWNRGV